MILKKLGKLLEKEGVSPIECLGKPFDPSKHNAVSTTEKEDVDGCVIIEELRKGYTLNDKVIRPSTVKVAVKPSSNSHKKETD
jgi:molecular chaperone GrpE